MDERLSAKVRVVNRAHEYGRQLYASLAKIFLPFVGEKVEKADGGLLARVEKLLPELPYGGDLRVFRHRSNYSLAWTVHTEELVATHVASYEVTVYVGNMQGGVLTELCNPFDYRADYTVEEIKGKRDAYHKAKRDADHLNSALGSFGVDPYRD